MVVFGNKVPFTLVFYLLDSGQDQIINFALEETIKEFRGIKATLLVDNIAYVQANVLGTVN